MSREANFIATGTGIKVADVLYFLMHYAQVVLNTGANDAQFMRTPRHDDANNRHRNEAGINRNHDEVNEVDSDKRRVFINHQATMTSIEPTHVPVHE